MMQKSRFKILWFLFVFVFVAQINSKDNPQKKLTEEQYQTILKKLQYLHTSERIQIIKSLDKLDKEEKSKFFDVLADLSLNDFDPLLIEASLRFLVDHKASCDKCIESYKSNLFHKEERIRLQALRGIETLKIQNIEDLVLKTLNQIDFQENSMFTHAFLRTIGNLNYNQKEITEILKEKFQREDTHIEIKRVILVYAGNSKNQDFKEILYQNLDNEEDLYLRAYSINALSKLALEWQEEEKIKLVQKLKEIYNKILTINNPTERVKYHSLKNHVIQALIRLKDDSVKEEIKKLAMDDDANTRLKALDYIEDLELKEFRELLEVKSLYDPSKSVKRKAKEILEKWSSSQ
ncbi:MAG: hypothetical protein NZ853_07785 [Leptospiraceae bacterium]|nr:hypothetical protein [Leptospiraceae bacterium]MDW7976928.1 hypothetical protein [Leptospiraceae bacterium]